jgi:hypothetical protein
LQHRMKSSGTQLWVISRTWSRLSTRTTLKRRKPLSLCQPRNPGSPRSTSTAFDCVGYELGSLLDARQKQPSTDLYKGNIQTGRILGSMKTTYECQYHGRLANYPLKIWLYRQKWKFSEFATCALAYTKAEKFSSTWSTRSVSMTAPGSLKIN